MTSCPGVMAPPFKRTAPTTSSTTVATAGKDSMKAP